MGPTLGDWSTNIPTQALMYTWAENNPKWYLVHCRFSRALTVVHTHPYRARISFSFTPFLSWIATRFLLLILALIHFKCKILNVCVWWHNERPIHCNKIIDECYVRIDRYMWKKGNVQIESWATTSATQKKKNSLLQFLNWSFFFFRVVTMCESCSCRFGSIICRSTFYPARKPKTVNQNKKWWYIHTANAMKKEPVLVVFSWRWIPSQQGNNKKICLIIWSNKIR